MADDKMVRLSPEVHAELKGVADDQKQQIGTMADALLEYAMGSPDRIEAALTQRKERGMAKTHTRRGGDGTWEPTSRKRYPPAPASNNIASGNR